MGRIPCELVLAACAAEIGITDLNSFMENFKHLLQSACRKEALLKT